MGTTRDWPAALAGTGVATLVLAVLVGALGPALTELPLGVLRVVVGGLLLTFGLQWLRKAILRAAGAKDKHDEEAIFATERAEAAAAPAAAGFDGYAFAISFKAVLLEGLEVAFIVLTFGANQHDVGLAAAAAALAILAVLGAGLALRAPLARVPENGMKFVVGVMLTSFGIFWGAEGAGADWPGGEAALAPLVAVVLVVALALVAEVRGRAPIAVPAGSAAVPGSARPGDERPPHLRRDQGLPGRRRPPPGAGRGGRDRPHRGGLRPRPQRLVVGAAGRARRRSAGPCAAPAPRRPAGPESGAAGAGDEPVEEGVDGEAEAVVAVAGGHLVDVGDQHREALRGQLGEGVAHLVDDVLASAPAAATRRTSASVAVAVTIRARMSQAQAASWG